jgi:two-component system, NtrC family, response regulator PilR
VLLYSANSSSERLAKMVRRLAPLSSTILLEGETGTGKSRLAGVIHALSPRRNDPFLVVNCGALSASLIESEMFGHAKGAFTGAAMTHVGKFAQVGAGTLLLDEIDTLPPAIQPKLLRAVEERVFEPVGCNKSQPMRARLIVASNRPLEEEVKAGRFRSDLFFRLNVISLELPPLRHRGWAVVEELSREFLARFTAQMQRRMLEIEPEALRALTAYEWPGNVRELRNVMERAVALASGGTIGLHDLPERIVAVSQTDGPPIELTFSEALPDYESHSRRMQAHAQEEIRRITEALEQSGHNRRRAAAALGISRMTLYNKLHKYHLNGPDGPIRPAPDRA